MASSQRAHRSPGVAVVTGASSGVGRAIARELGAQGARVALIARNVEALAAAAREIRESGGEALVIPLDVSDPQAVQDAADHVVAQWGNIDVWVNNAMISVFAPADRIKPAEYKRVTEVNYLGYVYGTLAALRVMKPRNEGVIVQIGSALAYRSIPLQSAYCASKAAIRGFTDSLRSELLHQNSRIQLTMLQLPAVNTPQFDVVRSRLSGHPQPVPPIYQPEVIAKAVLHAIRHPRREMWIGWSATKAILGQRLIPGLLDRYLAKKAWEGQTTHDLPEGHPIEHREDNIDAPIPGDRGAHGPFDSRSRAFSVKLWLRMHRGALALVGAAAALAFVLLLQGCGGAPYRLEPAPTAARVPGVDNAAAAAENGVQLAAQVQAWPGDPEVAEKVIPVKVAVINQSPEPIRIRYEDFVLVASDGDRYQAIPPHPSQRNLGEPEVNANPAQPVFAYERFAVAQHYAYAYPELEVYPGRFDYDPEYLTNYELWPGDGPPSDQVVARALPEGVLGSGGRLEGYLFFERMREDERSVELDVRLDSVASGRQLLDATIPFVVLEDDD